ncbi:MAG: hypothetical protein JKY70_02035 [Mucilaginibacter sp.]|nr:hypothetical protein [Mucilaginibacter sp.]
MEEYSGGFDRANDQGQNHDIKGNVKNVNNETLKQDEDNQNANPDLAKEIPTITPETAVGATTETPISELPNDVPELENPTDQTSSNKGQGPAGEDL